MGNKVTIKVRNAVLVNPHYYYPHEYAKDTTVKFLVAKLNGTDGMLSLYDGHPILVGPVIGGSIAEEWLETADRKYLLPGYKHA